VAWFDVGVNLLDRRFDADAVLQESADAQISHINIIASDLEESLNAAEFVRKNQDLTAIKLCHTAGIHPHYADNATGDCFLKLKSLLADTKVRAVGECGLDFNRNFSHPEKQLEVFERQLRLACEMGKGVYLHERDAFEHQYALLKRYSDDLAFKLVHCFTSTQAHMDEYLALGCYIGITGWVCDDKRGLDLQNAVKALPLERLVLETDAPYLFPKTVRPRPKNNAPKYLPAIAQKVAQLKKIDINELEKAAFENATRLFLTEE
jgi:TatD DNase family protein